MLQQSTRMRLEGVQSFGESSQAKRHPRREKPHFLVMQMPFVSDDGHWQDHLLFASEKVCQRFIIQAYFKASTQS